MGPTTKKILGQLLKQTDKAIKVTKDANLINELRQGRAAVLELMKSSTNGVAGLDPVTRKVTPKDTISKEEVEKGVAQARKSKKGVLSDKEKQLIIDNEITPQEVDSLFGAGTFAREFGR